MTYATARRVFVAVLLVINATLWAVPSNVVEQVAKDRPTLLGRYSRTHFYWIVGVFVVSLVLVYLRWPAEAARRRRRVFQLIAVLFSAGITLAAADAILRIYYPPAYVLDRLAFRRPPGAKYDVVHHDVPEARRSYPRPRGGFGDVRCLFSIDSRGYRNAAAIDQADIVVLGDSFAEGSRVTDDDVWAVQLARLTGRSVYNLGVSGYSPQHSVAAFETAGAALKPADVLCVVYEGNDFRETKKIEKPRIRLKHVLRTSPILQSVDWFLMDRCGRIGSTWALADSAPVDWLPIEVAGVAATTCYAFAPKQVMDLFHTEDEFRATRNWIAAREAFSALRDACRRAGARLTLVYAPVKAHVVLPLAAGVPPEKLRAFAALDDDDELPDAAAFATKLRERLDVKQQMVERWCREEGVGFLSLTDPLRAAVQRGEQPYYTYDQHWTPVGQRIAAEAIRDELASRPRPVSQSQP